MNGLVTVPVVSWSACDYRSLRRVEGSGLGSVESAGFVSTFNVAERSHPPTSSLDSSAPKDLRLCTGFLAALRSPSFAVLPRISPREPLPAHLPAWLFFGPATHLDNETILSARSAKAQGLIDLYIEAHRAVSRAPPPLRR